LVTQIRTTCEHERAKTSSAITVSLRSRRYALPASTNAPKRRQRSLSVSSHADTHSLRARTRQNVVSDHCQSLVTQIRTNCEHERAKTSSAITVGLWSRRYALSASTNAPKRRQRSRSVSGHADTHSLRARTRQNVVSNHCRSLVTQIRTNCEHERAKTSSAITVSLWSRRYAHTASTNAPKRRQRSLSVSGHSHKHSLRARTRQNVVSDHCQSLVTQIRTSCEHERAKTSSAITVSLWSRRYALSASTIAPKRRQRSLSVSGHADTHELRARTRQNAVSDCRQPLVTHI